MYDWVGSKIITEPIDRLVVGHHIQAGVELSDWSLICRSSDGSPPHLSQPQRRPIRELHTYQPACVETAALKIFLRDKFIQAISTQSYTKYFCAIKLKDIFFLHVNSIFKDFFYDFG